MKQFVEATCQKILDNIHHVSHVRYIKSGAPKFNNSDYFAPGATLEDLNSDHFYGPMCFRQIELPNFDHYLPTSYQVFEQQDVNANIQEDTISLPVIATPIENDTIDKVYNCAMVYGKLPEYIISKSF